MITITMPLKEYEGLMRKLREVDKFKAELEQRISKAFEQSKNGMLIRDDEKQMLWLSGAEKEFRESFLRPFEYHEY